MHIFHLLNLYLQASIYIILVLIIFIKCVFYFYILEERVFIDLIFYNAKSSLFASNGDFNSAF